MQKTAQQRRNKELEKKGEGLDAIEEIKTEETNDLEETASEASSEEKKLSPEEEKKQKVIKEVLDWVKTICIGIIAGVLLVVFVIQRDNVTGDSMVSTLHSGDVIFTQKLATYFHAFDRGDIVILDGEGMEGYYHSEYLIKRIVGLPGETVKIEDGKVYIKPKDSNDFFVLEEPYLDEGITTYVMDSGIEKGYDNITLGEDEYFCLGDNRPVSNDSRLLGPFKYSRLKGKALIRIYPFNQIRVF